MAVSSVSFFIYTGDMNTYVVRSRAVIIHEGKLLVVKHPGRDFYVLPGGHLDPGEDPKECMERELVEELGILPKVGKLLFVYTYTNATGVQSIEFFFEIENGEEYLSHDAFEKTHAHEIEEVSWITPSDDVRLLPQEFHTLFKEGRVGGDLSFIREK